MTIHTRTGQADRQGWKPWDVLSLIVILLPMGYAVWRTRDIRIGIAVHIGLSGTGFLTNSLPTLLVG